MNDMLYKKIEELKLSVRSTNCLHAERITLVSELIKLTKKQVLQIPRMGKKQLSEIKDAIAVHGLEFGTYVPDEGTIVKIYLDADFILQAYTRDIVCIDGIQKLSNRKTMLACFTTFKDYNDPEEEQLREILSLRDCLLAAYAFYPDGDVTVELIIKDEMVNA